MLWDVEFAVSGPNSGSHDIQCHTQMDVWARLLGLVFGNVFGIRLRVAYRPFLTVHLASVLVYARTRCHGETAS